VIQDGISYIVGVGLIEGCCAESVSNGPTSDPIPTPELRAEIGWDDVYIKLRTLNCFDWRCHVLRSEIYSIVFFLIVTFVVAPIHLTNAVRAVSAMAGQIRIGCFYAQCSEVGTLCSKFTSKRKTGAIEWTI
jgi:hypothetical protein